MYQRLCQTLNNWHKTQYSILIVPDAGSAIKQVRLKALFIYAVLFLMVSAGIFLSISSIVLVKDNFSIKKDHVSLVEESHRQDSEIQELSTINTQLEEENTRLRNSTELSTEYFNRRVDDLDSLQKEIDSLLKLFNKENNSNIKISTSRSGIQIDADHIVPLLARANTLEDIESSDDITRAIQMKITDYNRVVKEVEKEFKMMDGKPNLKPAVGSITSYFGYRTDPMNGTSKHHDGIDIDNETGTPIKAAGSGVVTFSGYNGSYGNVLIISHGFGYKTVYAHLNECIATTGQKVKKGEKIAYMGSTGRSTGSHLHFEVHFEGQKIDPMSVLTK